jgi:hypothetical protein
MTWLSLRDELAEEFATLSWRCDDIGAAMERRAIKCGFRIGPPGAIKCPVCGALFSPLHLTRVYCSSRCKNRVPSKLQRDYAVLRASHVRWQKFLAWQRASRAGRGRVELDARKCMGCGVTFVPPTRKRVYCTSRCRAQAWRRRRPSNCAALELGL